MNLIVVSNRVSSLSDKAAAAGGLAAALYQGMRNSGGMWFGWSGKTVEGEPEPPTVTSAGKARLVTIDYPEADFADFYNGMANGTLWPIMHNRVDLMVYDPAFMAKYERINQRVATEIAKFSTDDAIFWVHDYHFLMLGHFLRQIGIKRPLGFFLHTPFPAHSSIECVPHHRDLFRHLLSYDLIGFQTEEDMAAFAQYATRELGAVEVNKPAPAKKGLHPLRNFFHRRSQHGLQSSEGLTRMGVYPVGIDANEYAKMAEEAEKDSQVIRLKGALGEGSTIIGVDRLDYSKGLPQRFRAFERLLADQPGRRERVNLLQIAPLTRSDVSAYQALQDELAALTGRINGRFGNPSWQPIRYTNESYTPAVLAGFYRICDVCCLTPLRDGMNLVAKEFVASQDENNPGVLVLSQFAGASHELDAALIVNPYDTIEVAIALERALSMTPEERQERWRAMMKVLRVNDVSAWFDGFVTDLGKTQAREHDAGLTA